jgi:hypothetical protein
VLTHLLPSRGFHFLGQNPLRALLSAMAAPAGPPAAPALSVAFCDAMDNWKGGAQPWGLRPAFLHVLDSFFGGVAAACCPLVHPVHVQPRAILGSSRHGSSPLIFFI